MIVEQLPPEEWRKLSEQAFIVVFNEKRPAEMDRIDFALLAKSEEGQLHGFLTCREFDSESLYWQFGGTFPGTIKTSLSYEVCHTFLGWAQEKYKRVSCVVENTNAPMLKMAAAVGFKIIGVRTVRGTILVEHLLEFENAGN